MGYDACLYQVRFGNLRHLVSFTQVGCAHGLNVPWSSINNSESVLLSDTSYVTNNEYTNTHTHTSKLLQNLPIISHLLMAPQNSSVILHCLYVEHSLFSELSARIYHLLPNTFRNTTTITINTLPPLSNIYGRTPRDKAINQRPVLNFYLIFLWLLGAIHCDTLHDYD
jgi:hypothetical protein